MEGLSKFIFDSLAAKQTVVLPSIGTFGVERIPAQISKHKLQPPLYTVLFSTTQMQDRESIVDTIVRNSGIEWGEAQNIYNEWLAASSHDNSLTIAQVGEVRDGNFTISDELHKRLNPTTNDQCRIKPRSRCRVWTAILVVLALLLLLLSAMFFCPYFVKCRECVANAPVAAPVEVVATAPPAADTVATRSKSIDSKGYYVVLGVFAQDSNADLYIKQALALKPDLECQKMAYKGKIMVTIYSTDDETDAIRNMRQLRVVNEEVWVYRKTSE